MGFREPTDRESLRIQEEAREKKRQHERQVAEYYNQVINSEYVEEKLLPFDFVINPHEQKLDGKQQRSCAKLAVKIHQALDDGDLEGLKAYLGPELLPLQRAYRQVSYQRNLEWQKIYQEAFYLARLRKAFTKFIKAEAAAEERLRYQRSHFQHGWFRSLQSRQLPAVLLCTHDKVIIPDETVIPDELKVPDELRIFKQWQSLVDTMKNVLEQPIDARANEINLAKEHKKSGGEQEFKKPLVEAFVEADFPVLLRVGTKPHSLENYKVFEKCMELITDSAGENNALAVILYKIECKWQTALSNLQYYQQKQQAAASTYEQSTTLVLEEFNQLAEKWWFSKRGNRNDFYQQFQQQWVPSIIQSGIGSLALESTLLNSKSDHNDKEEKHNFPLTLLGHALRNYSVCKQEEKKQACWQIVEYLIKRGALLYTLQANQDDNYMQVLSLINENNCPEREQRWRLLQHMLRNFVPKNNIAQQIHKVLHNYCMVSAAQVKSNFFSWRYNKDIKDARFKEVVELTGLLHRSQETANMNIIVAVIKANSKKVQENNKWTLRGTQLYTELDKITLQIEEDKRSYQLVYGMENQTEAHPRSSRSNFSG